MPSLQARLAQLSAPEPFVRWARPFTDFPSCWDACPDASWMLWAAARLSQTIEQRRAIVCCAAAVGELAAGGHKDADPRIIAAFTAVRIWARGTADQAAVAAAGRAALDAASDAAGLAAREAPRARALFSLAPRRRLASVTTSRAIAAHHASRAAARQEAAAYAAAWTVRSAAEADTTMGLPQQWAACVSRVATYAVIALSPPPGPARRRPAGRAAARCARTVRRCIPCPQLG
jgi:hypothetical protein